MPLRQEERTAPARGIDAYHMSYAYAEKLGIKSRCCDPVRVLYDVRCATDRRPPRRCPSRAQTVEWILQNGPEVFFSEGSAILLLRVLSYTACRNGKPPRAWIGRAKLAEIAGKHRKTIDTYACALTAPWKYGEGWFPPIYRVQLVGRGQRRRAEWEPLQAGWAAFGYLFAGAVAARRVSRLTRPATRWSTHRTTPQST